MILCRSLGIGGAERQISVLSKGLVKSGCEVSLAVFYAGGAIEKELSNQGVSVIDLKKSGRWDLLHFFRRLVGVVGEEQPEAIYGFMGPSNMLTVLLKILYPKVKVVWGVRSSYVDLARYDWLASVSYRLECYLSRFTDLIICNSHAGFDFASAHGFPKSKMVVVPNGFDTDLFKPDQVARKRVRDEWNVLDCEVLIGLVARLDPMKGHETFIRAAAKIAKVNANVRFVCVGVGPDEYMNGLRELSSALGLDEILIWAGERKDMPAVSNALDIASSTSYGEGFSNTLAEAMACGVPCVATDVGDTAMIVTGTGLVVPPESPEALSIAFERTISNITLALKEKSRNSIVMRYSNERLVEDTLKAIHQLF